MPSYVDFVSARSNRNPCLQALSHFLTSTFTTRKSHVICLEMGAKDGVVRETTPDFQDLANMLSETTNLQGPIGRILFLQDLNRDLVELLGSSLGIDPMFFATHVYGPYNHGSSPKPSWAKLPSKVRKQNFLNLQYQRVIEFDGNPGPVGRLIQSGNVPRKVAILPPTKNKYLGLTLYSCSALLHTPKSGPWTGETQKWREIVHVS